jgi:hypothetical protein
MVNSDEVGGLQADSFRAEAHNAVQLQQSTGTDQHMFGEHVHMSLSAQH